MTHATTPFPDVPLPPGAIADADGWEAWDNRFRVIFTPDETVPGTDIHVYGRAQQFPDGHVDDGTLDPEHPPQVAIDECWLSIDQARAAAAMISRRRRHARTMGVPPFGARRAGHRSRVWPR
ncbi:hypothetical protein NJB1507_23940 [Mycobacterium marinum]|nr:hypothetical protein NJB1507_23940 [Mycobacterium marinum]